MKALAWMAKNLRRAADPLPSPRCRLVVLERLARWEDGLESGDFERTAIVSEEASEGMLSLIRRIAIRVASFERHGVQPTLAMLFVGPKEDEQSMTERERVAEALVQCIKSGGELVIVALGADAAQRDGLLSLVGRMLGRLDSRQVTIRVQFREEHAAPVPKSGVRFAAPSV
jgi:hypothetical protein